MNPHCRGALCATSLAVFGRLIGLAAFGASTSCGGRTSLFDEGIGLEDAASSQTVSSSGGVGASSGVAAGGSGGDGSSRDGSSDAGSRGEGSSSGGMPTASSSGVSSGGSTSSVSGGSGNGSSGMATGSSSGACGGAIGSSVGYSSTCLACIASACPAELAACDSGCSCNERVSHDLYCTGPEAISDGGETAIADCFASTLGAADNSDTAGSLFQCLWAAAGECSSCNNPFGLLDAATDSNASCIDRRGLGGSQQGGSTCSTTALETCGAATYQAVCSCPDGKCVCFGDVTTVVAYSGCPSCPNGEGDPEIFAACGFPK